MVFRQKHSQVLLARGRCEQRRRRFSGIEPDARSVGDKGNECRLTSSHHSVLSCRRTVLSFIHSLIREARCSSVVRAFAHGAMGRRIDPSWGGPTELFLVPASAPRLV